LDSKLEDKRFEQKRAKSENIYVFSTLFKISKIFGGETSWKETMWKTGKEVDFRETDYDNISTKYSRIISDTEPFYFTSGDQIWYFVNGC